MYRFLFLVTIFFFSLSLHAQIVEAEKVMTTGSNNALILEIPNSDVKIVEKVWKSYAKSFNGKVKKMNNDLKKLGKEKLSYEKAIEDYRQKILDAEASIENNILEQERMNEAIEAQNGAIEIVKKKLANLNN